MKQGKIPMRSSERTKIRIAANMFNQFARLLDDDAYSSETSELVKKIKELERETISLFDRSFTKETPSEDFTEG